MVANTSGERRASAAERRPARRRRARRDHARRLHAQTAPAARRSGRGGAARRPRARSPAPAGAGASGACSSGGGGRLGAVAAVAPVLAGEPLERVARRCTAPPSPAGRRSGCRAREPRRQLGVLVDGPALVPAAEALERLAPPDAGERPCRPRSPPPPRPISRRRPRRARSAARAPPAATTCPSPTGICGPLTHVDVAALEALDALRQVVRRVVGVGVHPRDVVAARVSSPMFSPNVVRRCGLSRTRMRSVGGRHLLEDLVRAVVRVAVHEEELDLAVEALGEHGLDRLADVPLLVEDRDQHADVYFYGEGLLRRERHGWIIGC